MNLCYNKSEDKKGYEFRWKCEGWESPLQRASIAHGLPPAPSGRAEARTHFKIKEWSKNVQTQINLRCKQESDILAKKIEVPKINQVIIQYNGNEKAFDFFMESTINDFLNSCSIAKAEQSNFIGNVENVEKSA